MKHLILGVLAGLVIAATNTAVNAQIPTKNPNLPNGSSNVLNYPPGTQIYPSGGIRTPDGKVTYPNAVVLKGDGTTTYYYSNGTRIDLNRSSINSSGTYLSPGTVNGGVRGNTTIRLYQPPKFPGNAK